MTASFNGLLTRETHVIAAGVDLLADAVAAQAVPVDRVDWRPPMEGAADDLARVMGDPRRAAANDTAVSRVLAAEAQLVDVRPAREALGLEPGTFLHAGPPIDWDRASGPLRGALIGAAVFEGMASDPDQAQHLTCWLPGARRSTPATTGTPSGRWPASSAAPCGCSNWPTRQPGGGRTAR
jgi:hypothetical protein